MKELIEKSKYDIRKLKLLITKYTAKEFDGLSEPCYYPKTKLSVLFKANTSLDLGP